MSPASPRFTHATMTTDHNPHVDLPITTDKHRSFLTGVEIQKAALTKISEALTTLTTHFTTLSETLNSRHQKLHSNLEILKTTPSETLTSLSARESAVPILLSSHTSLIARLKSSSLARLQDSPEIPDDLHDHLKYFCHCMDAAGLLDCLASRKRRRKAIKAELSIALAEAVDRERLVLDAVEEFIRGDRAAAAAMAVGILVKEAVGTGENGMFSRRVKERAARLAEEWKGSQRMRFEEKAAWLEMVGAFGLKGRFEPDELRKVIAEVAGSGTGRRMDVGRVAVRLGFGDDLTGLCCVNVCIRFVYYLIDLRPVQEFGYHLCNSDCGSIADILGRAMSLAKKELK